MNTKNCNANYSDIKLTKALTEIVGNNLSLHSKVILKVVDKWSEDSRVYNDDFIKYIKENHPKLEKDLDKSNVSKNLAKAMFEYYRTITTNAEDFTKENKQNKKVVTYGYTSTAVRQLGISFAVIDVLNKYMESGMTLDAKKEYLLHLRNTWFTRLCQLAVDNKVKRYGAKTIYRNLDEVKTDFIENVKKVNDEVEAAYNARKQELINELYENVYSQEEAEDAEREIEEKLKEEFSDKQANVITSLDFFKSIFGGNVDNATIKNTLAFYNELMSNNESLLNDILYNSKAQDIYHKINKDEQVTATQLEEGELLVNGVAESTEDGDASPDMSIQIFDHSGIHKSYMVHIGERLRNYFNTLPKLLDNSQFNAYKTDNIYCIPEYMDARECVTELYNANINWNNLEEMINVIRDISSKKVEFASFGKLADDLEKNPDFATELATVFSKIKIDKLEVVENNGEVKTNIANSSTNPRNIFFSTLLNDAKNNINNNTEVLDTILSEFAQEFEHISSLAGYNSKNVNLVAELTDNIIKILKTAYPSLNTIAIKSYIQLNNSGETNVVRNRLANIQTLYNFALNISSNAKNARTILNEREVAVEIAKRKNDGIAQDIAAGHFVDESYEDIEAISNDDSYVKAFYPSANEITNALLPYTSVKTELNHRNIEGNNNSDIINNSLLGAIHKMMAQTTYDENNKPHNPVLLDWVVSKLRLPQYRYNTFLETKSEKIRNKRTGEVIETIVHQYGLVEFDEDSGEYKLSDWAPELFDVQLFQGSSSMSENKNLPYSKMTKGDYIPTRFCSFFTTDAVFGTEKTKDNVATYFTKTPSDAPKIYTFRGPKFDTTGLLTIANEADFDNNIRTIINSLLKPVTNENKEAYRNFYNSFVNKAVYDKWLETDDQYKNRRNLFYSNLTQNDTDKIFNLNGQSLLVVNRNAIKELDNNRSVVVFKTRENALIAVEGNVITRNGMDSLINCKIVGLTGDFNISKGDINTPINAVIDKFFNYYKEKAKVSDISIVNGDERYTIDKATFVADRNHKVFNLLKEQYYQEILNAVNALYKYFEFQTPQYVNENGKKVDEDTNELVIQLKNGKPIFRSGYNNSVGYKFYHKGSSGNVLDLVNDKYVLNGNVFKSNKFTLVVDTQNPDGTITAKKVNYFEQVDDVLGDKVIDFLYGGSIRVVINKTDHGEDYIDFVFDKEQEATIQENINNRLEHFIIDCVNAANERLSAYSDFTNDIPTSFENNMQYVINERLMAFNADMIFDGDSKFYKDSQTVLKRVKQSQGSGIPYGIADTSRTITDPVNTEVSHSYLNSKEVQDVFKGTMLEGLKQTHGFYGVTISNSVRTNHTALRQLADKLVSIGNLTEKQAYALLFGEIEYDSKGNPKTDKNGNIISKKGFTHTKVNDAQSYITFQEFVRRIAARGQLEKYLPVIQKILDENSVLNAEDIKEFVQVQKNFYYDMYYDEEFDIEVPRQIKNAEFVLIPRFIKGTQLEEVYNYMIQNDIQQLNTVETSKAANREILNLWNDDGDITEENATAFNTKARDLKQVFLYSNLYTQQETPQHMNAENKAGIQIVKKLLDNLPNTEYWNTLKNEYFSLFSENIIESFNKVAKEFEFSIDADGNLNFNDDGSVNINKEKFFEKFKEELMRNGIDSNMLKCCTIEEDESEPAMPLTINSLINKFESVAQSLFNSNITKQKLPGFHAAQVTNVGWKGIENVVPEYSIDKLEKNSHYKEFKASYTDKIKTVKRGDKLYLHNETKQAFVDFIKDKFKNVSYNKELRYHPNGEPYIEIMVPYSFIGIDKNSAYYKNKTDEEILKELEAEGKNGKFGLNDLIGYRIPTEGKQSMCNMKVVGFIDDSLGSTIIVPDDWVSQTGSDFDIDSVYAITYEVKKLNSGKLIKRKYNDNPTEKDWINYIDKNTPFFKDIKNKYFKDYHEAEEKAYSNLSDTDTKLLKKIHEMIRGKLLKESLTTRTSWSEKIKQELNIIEKNKAKFSNNIGDYVKAITELKKVLDDVLLVVDKQELIDTAINHGLLTLDEYLDKANITKINSRQQRNSRILEIMQTILSSDETLEENLSRSNFDDISDARDELMSSYTKIHREGRSPYDPFDQADYQEEAMSGAKLKGFSVSLDTLCSVCNVAKPKLTRPITIIYENDSKHYNAKDIKNRFNAKSTKDSIIVTHNTYGWSYDNRNVTGKLLTAYSSQTTAFILDAIKEGSLINVNDYTFSVFKTFVNVGSDYRVAINFMQQPAISALVSEFNKSKSVFSSENNNAIDSTIQQIARRLGVQDVNRSTISILNTLNEVYKDRFVKLFGITDKKFNISYQDASIQSIPIIFSMLNDRKNGVGFKSPVEETLFDLGVILSFKYIKNIADEVGDIANSCKPDKFGAKQTVFATREVFNSIEKAVNTKNPILTVDGKHMLDAIYPGVVDYVKSEEDIELYQYILQNCDITKSKYSTLCSYLKYASATSIAVARSLFDTQSAEFVQLVEGINNIAGKNKDNKFNEEVASDVQKYILSDFYNSVPSVKYPIYVELNSDNTFSFVIPDETRENESLTDDETLRIYGYGYPVGASYFETIITDEGKALHREKQFTCADKTKPTQEEIDAFCNLSPAQKVYWIKNNFDDAGVFEFITPVLSTSIKKRQQVGMQTLAYKDDQIDPNTVFDSFNAMFNSSNPLLALTALDVIKYAIKVEGMMPSNTAVNKIINFDVLINDLNDGGIGFVDNYTNKFSELYARKHILNQASSIDTLYENYLRSHPSCPLIDTVNYVTQSQIKKAGLDLITNYCFQLCPSVKENGELDMDDFKRRINYLKIGTLIEGTVGLTQFNPVKYIRMNILDNGAQKSVLFKVIKNTDTSVFLYPLTNLQPTENTRWSVNQKNNEVNNVRILSSPTYEAIISKMIKQQVDRQIQLTKRNNKEDIAEIISEAKEEIIAENPYDKNAIRKQYAFNANVSTLLDLNEAYNNTESKLHGFASTIITYFETEESHETNLLYLRNGAASRYFLRKGGKNFTFTTITSNNGVTDKFKIANFSQEEVSKHIEGRKQGNDFGKTYNQILDNLIEDGYTTNSDVIAIQKINGDEAMAAATLEESLSDSISIMSSSMIHGNDKAAMTLTDLKRAGIDRSIDSIKAKPTFASMEVATWHKNESMRLIDEYTYFMEIEDAENPMQKVWLNAVDPKVIAMAKQDRRILERLMRLSNDISSFIKASTGYNDFVVESDNADILRYVREIQKSNTDVLENIKHAQLDKEINNIWASTVSTNPLIKSHLIDVMDGFYKTYGAMWKFHDIMENGTPLLQIIMKDVMGDIDAKRIHDITRHENYIKEIKRIQKAAAEHGLSVNLSKIINKDGDFVDVYNEQFTKDLNKYYKAIGDAIEKHGLYSYEHLLAKHIYEGFKAYHLNQEAKQEYYIEKFKLEEKIFGLTEDDIPSEHGMSKKEQLEYIQKTYARYIELGAEIHELLSEDIETRSDETKRRLTELLTERNSISSPNMTLDPDPAIGLLSSLIHEMSQKVGELERTYFNIQKEDRFDEKLNKCLATIALKEKRDGNCIPTVDLSSLENDAEYQAAQSWIINNARYVPTGSANGQGNTILLSLEKAYETLNTLRTTPFGKLSKFSSIMNRANGGKGIKDGFGIRNGSLLTETELQDLRNAQNDAYTMGVLNVGTDRVLINNANRDLDEYYSKEFYDRLKRKGGTLSRQYYETVTKANFVLQKYYDDVNQTVDIFKIPDTDEGRQDLKTLKECYQLLSVIDKFAIGSYEAADKDFIDSHVDFKTNDRLFEIHKQQFNGGRGLSKEYTELMTWVMYNCKPRRNEEGQLIRDAAGHYIYDIEMKEELQDNPNGEPTVIKKAVPNRRLYGFIQLKETLPEGETREQWMNPEIKKALTTINYYIRTNVTRYYDRAKVEALKKDAQQPGYWKEWYAKNHVYNPYTRKVEPLECWLQREYKWENINNELEFKWEPRKGKRVVKDGNVTVKIRGVEHTVYNASEDKRNEHFKKDDYIANNYIPGSNPSYDNKLDLNEYEIEMRNYLKTLLLASTSNNYNAKKFFSRNHLPRMAKPTPLTAKKVGNEALKMFGFNLSPNSGDQDFANDKEMDYAFDILPDMPNIKALGNKDVSDKKAKIKELRNQEIVRDKYNSQEEFEKAIDDRNKQIEQLENEIKDIRKELQNTNWYEVIDKYLENASRYNAIQDNKQKLYYLLRALENMQMYSRRYGASGDLKREDRSKNDDNKIYSTDVDDNLIKQYKNQLRRLLYEQYKQPENKLTTIANQLQGFTSASYMMMNVKGGIANVTLGNTGILAEAAAKEFLGVKDWNFGRSEWRKGIIGYGRRGFANMTGYDQCFNKQDAIIQFFDVVDYDEHTGVVREISLDEYAEKLRNFMFSPQTIGEHYMQNSVLFAMLHSHKLITTPDTGVIPMSKSQYIAYKQAEILNEFLTDAQKEEFEKFKEEIKKDKNSLKDYAWFRKDLITEFVYLHCNKETVNKYLEKRDANAKTYGEEFDKLKDIYSQIDFKDGKMAFVEGSELDQLNHQQYQEGSELTKATAILGRFAEKVRKVNNKIHGVYNKEGSAYIEKEWFGSLVMQYHKHLPMGLLKRYMRRGHYNETRQSIDKGMNESVYDLFSLNWRKVKAEHNLTEENIGAMQSFTFFWANLADYFIQLKTTWKVLPEYDKANIRRKIGDAVGVVAAMLATAALWAAADDDDEMQDSVWWNLSLYEADRLASEAFMYNPYGLMVEGKKLLSNPIATQSIIEDGYNILKSIGEALFDSDYEPYYQSGRFSGRRKISVYIQRRIPMYHGIHSIIDLPDNNHYYKLGQNPIGLFNVKDMVTDN